MKTRGPLLGSVRLELVSADIPHLLEAINGQGIILRDIRVRDLLTIQATVSRSQYKTVRRLARQQGGVCKPLEKRGLYWSLKNLIGRPVLVFGVLLLLFLSAFLPTRVLFVTVEGNDAVPVKLILEQAKLCGIGFGASRRTVRSESVKNMLLSQVPQLEWAGVNTRGCTAIISVRERPVDQKAEPQYSVSRMIAARDGIVDSCIVTKGNALCHVGQAVKKGQVLISGYTDCGISIQATRAEGEIYALTNHTMSAIFPMEWTQKGEKQVQKKKYSLILGKFRINFSKDSGISYTSCDKMYSEYYVTLPGGSRLPVALAVETYITREENPASYPPDAAEAAAEACIRDQVSMQMISGIILESDISSEETPQVLRLQGRFICREMIGRVQNEEIIYDYGENYGEDR